LRGIIYSPPNHICWGLSLIVVEPIHDGFQYAVCEMGVADN